MNSILKHKDKGHICPILLQECPFNEKTFVQSIQLGRQQIEREFLDEIMDTVISDMNMPQMQTRIQTTKSWKDTVMPLTQTKIKESTKLCNYGCLFLSSFMLIANFIFAINLSFGIGKFYTHITKFLHKWHTCELVKSFKIL